MSNYPPGAEAYLNKQGRDEQALEDAADNYHAQFLDEAIADPAEFLSEWVNSAEEITEMEVKVWAQLRKKSEAAAKNMAQLHGLFESVLNRKVLHFVEKNADDITNPQREYEKDI
jgi:hypothetical protein